MARMRSQFKDQAAPEVLEAKILEEMKKQLDKRIEDKLLCQDAARELKDNTKNVKDHMARIYESKLIPDLMKKFKAGSRQDLNDMVLKEWGISLETHKQQFIESTLASEWAKKQLKTDNDEVGHDEMLDYYHEHVTEFETPPRARWEELVVRKGSDAREAHAKICAMGNWVLDGAAFAEVAKAHSQGASGPQGGQRDWTSRGSLVSKPLDQAIFCTKLEPGQLSPVFEDEQAYYIIRVLEREPPVRTPFLEAQTEVKEKIRKKHALDAKSAYLAKLKKRTRIWNSLEDKGETAGVAGLANPGSLRF